MSTDRRIINSASVPPEDCIFCQIVSRRLPSFTVYEDGEYIAFLDKNPFNPGHTLVCPKRHGETVWDMSEKAIGGLFALAARVSKAVVAAMNADGFRILQNNGEAANQVVPHVHVHVIPASMGDKGRFLDRKVIPSEEMERIASSIRARLEV